MTSLSKNARVAGLLYVVGSLVAVVRLIYIPNTLIVSDNATATVNNIATHELLFRFGTLTQLLTGRYGFLLRWLFIVCLKDVDKGLAVLMVILGSLMVTPIFFMNSVNDAAALRTEWRLLVHLREAAARRIRHAVSPSPPLL